MWLERAAVYGHAMAMVREHAPDAATVPKTRGLSFRPDVEGLRGIAVALVVLLHVGVTGVSGGYIGVDVFFVISGFLITSLLIDEFAATDRVSMLGFYSRRARRILPAACIVIAVTVIAVYLQLGALIGKHAAVDGVWAAGFLANFRFISTGTNYFASALPPSALQHYWSLAVEEQFYFVWPTVFFGLMLLGRRLGRSTLTLRGGLLAVVGCSLLWSIRQSAATPTTAYFSPLTRAWELGAGALIAAFATHLPEVKAIVRAIATWIGLALIMIAAFTFTSTTVFPGYAALVPVVGAGLVITGGIGQPTAAAGLVLGIAPVRWIGRISFSLYLWHWPVIVIAEQRTSQQLSGLARIVCVLTALALSVASYYCVERPLHMSAFLKPNADTNWHRARKALLAGAVAITVAVAVSLVTDNRATSSINAALRERTNESATSFALLKPGAQVAAMERQIEDGVRQGLALRSVPTVLNPPVLGLKTAFVHKYSVCMQSQPEAVAAKTCNFGATDQSSTIIVFGDSHAMSWMPALDAYGKAAGYKIVTLYKARCPLPSANPQCTTWRNNALEYIGAHRPVAVIMSFTQAVTLNSKTQQNGWINRYRKVLEQLKPTGAALVGIGNNPLLAEDPGLCLGRPNADPSTCRASYVARPVADAELALVRREGGTAIDPKPWLCVDTQCPVIIGGYIAYADTGHLSAQYVTRVAPLVAAQLHQAGLR